MFGSTLKRGNERHESSSAWENDIIELTDSESNGSSDLPDMLSPLIKGPRRKEIAGSRRQQSSSERFVPLYVDTSDEGEPDKDCILVLCVLGGTFFQFAHFCLGMIPQAPDDPFRASPLPKV